MTLLPLALLLACQQTTFVEGNFDGPTGVAVLLPEQGGPFYEPIALVANSRSGTLVGLDVKHAAILAEDATAPFLGTAVIPTGRARILGDLALYAPDTQTVTVFVADAFTRTLVELPWIDGVEDDGRLILRSPSLAADPVFTDTDGSGDSARFERLVLRPRFAADEDWTFTFDGEVWRVSGSRSGPMALPAQTLVPYESAGSALDLLISGSASAGDTLSFSVDAGVVEHDLGGYIESLQALPAAGLLLASVSGTEEGLGAVVVFDMATRTVLGSLPLPEGAAPGRLTSDPSGELVYVADRRQAAVYEVLLDSVTPDSSAVRTLEMRAPVSDIAWQADEDYEHLFVAPIGENRVDVYDLVEDTWVDVNVWTPEVDGIRLEAPVTGLSAADSEVLTQQETAWGARVSARLVAISTFDGAMVLAQGQDGCLAQNTYGPYGALDDDDPFQDESPVSDPWVEAGGSTGRSVQVNPCAGIARSETWTATFVAADNNWVVRGSLSGEQLGRARTDERYTSDGGEMSFLILSGGLPYTEGDRVNMLVSDGVARISGDLDGSGALSQGERTVEVPGRPVVLSYLAGPTGGGWDVVNRKVMALWPITNSDNVLRVNLQTLQLDVWE